MKKFCTLFLLMLCIYCDSSAQELQSDLKTTASDYFTGPGYNLSWTIGEAVILTVSDSTITMTQGFQQPKVKKKYVKEDLPKKDNIDIGPNPARDEIEIVLDRDIDKNIPMRADIYDVIGRRVLTSEFRGQRFSISISAFASGVYFIKVFVDGQELGTQKVQKID